MSNEKTEQSKPEWQGIWIPRHLWENKNLTVNEKCLFAQIDMMDNNPDKGCFASNSYFGQFFNLKPNTISGTIKSLKQKGFIEIVYKLEMTKKGFITQRFMFVKGKIRPGAKVVTPSVDRIPPPRTPSAQSNPPSAQSKAPSVDREQSLNLIKRNDKDISLSLLTKQKEFLEGKLEKCRSQRSAEQYNMKNKKYFDSGMHKKVMKSIDHDEKEYEDVYFKVLDEIEKIKEGVTDDIKN